VPPAAPELERELLIAVVQPRLVAGDAGGNLRRLRDLIARAAREHEPELLLLPDALASPPPHRAGAAGAIAPIDGEPYEMLRRAAREHGCWVGGGYLAIDTGGVPRHAYVLAEPSGATHVHRKDRPDPWESRWVVGGTEDGFASTPLGPIGLVCGLEWQRTQTAERLAGGVLLLAGGASPVAPSPWRERAATQSREGISRLARTVGAPAAVAQQVGRPHARLPFELAGESRIVERDGRVVASLSAADGEGYVSGRVRLAEPEPQATAPHGAWQPGPPLAARGAMRAVAAAGRSAYRRRLRAVGLAARGPRPQAAIAAYNLPDLPPEERAERLIIANPVGTDPVPPREPARV
jgi:predicted amidohydrolase